MPKIGIKKIDAESRNNDTAEDDTGSVYIMYVDV